MDVLMIENEGLLIEIEFKVTSYGHPGITSGPPENCEPPEPIEFDILNTYIVGKGGEDKFEFEPIGDLKDYIDSSVFAHIALTSDENQDPSDYDEYDYDEDYAAIKAENSWFN